MSCLFGSLWIDINFISFCHSDRKRLINDITFVDNTKSYYAEGTIELIVRAMDLSSNVTIVVDDNVKYTISLRQHIARILSIFLQARVFITNAEITSEGKRALLMIIFCYFHLNI